MHLGAYWSVRWQGVRITELMRVSFSVAEDFMLCKSESADPAHCLKEGRRVTRCAQDLYVPVTSPPARTRSYAAYPAVLSCRIAKLRENCLSEFNDHWGCLEKNNQVRPGRTCRPARRTVLRHALGRNTTTAARTSVSSTSASSRSS